MSHPDMPENIRNSFLEIAVSESDRMTRIVQDLLVLSRLDNNRTRWNVTEYNLNDSVNRVCEVMRVDANTHSHMLSFVPDESVDNITADKDRIEQVIINIISNSVKYCPDGGKIAISTKNLGKTVRITIKDNGIGIPDEDLGHLFERFYRVEKSRTSETGGTGLGLAIAKELVNAHGGTIRIKSKLGEGTEVIIELPKKTELVSTEDIA